MKKLIALALILALATIIAACGHDTGTTAYVGPAMEGTTTTEAASEFSSETEAQITESESAAQENAASSFSAGNSTVAETTADTSQTQSLAVLMPFWVQEIQDSGGVYFGDNAISRNLILCNKARLQNPNAFLLGIPGSGKSFSAKVHEPIIDRATWDRVRELDRTAMEGCMGKKAPEDTLFCRKLVCADCGGPMVSHPISRRGKDGIRRRTGTSYHCYRHSMSGYTACSWHSISENALKAMILKELQTYATLLALDEAAVLNQLKKKMAAGDADEQALLRGEVKRLQKRLADLERIAADLYEDKVAQKISEIAFASLIKKNEQERQARQGQLDETQARLSAAEEALLNVNQWAEMIRRHVNLNDLCRADVEDLIEHMEIGESDYTQGFRCQDAKIFWKFVGALDEH